MIDSAATLYERESLQLIECRCCNPYRAQDATHQHVYPTIIIRRKFMDPHLLKLLVDLPIVFIILPNKKGLGLLRVRRSSQSERPTLMSWTTKAPYVRVNNSAF